jgi:uncharacterized protein YbaR (Trm112 family)
MPKIYICPKCKEPLDIETDETLKEEYKFICHNCEENFYQFEAIIIRSEYREVG